MNKCHSVQPKATAYQTNLTSVYNWLYRYSLRHKQKCTLVVQMQSEAIKNTQLLSRIAGLEHIVSQKQMEVDFPNKILEAGSGMGFDVNPPSRIIGYKLSDNMRAEQNLEALKMALQTRGARHYVEKPIHHSDEGTPYASYIYTIALGKAGIKISMCREVWENTYMERINLTTRNQYLYRFMINNEKQLAARVAEVVKTYNEAKPHKSLNRLTPLQYENSLQNIQEEKRSKMTIFISKQTRQIITTCD